MPYELTYGPTQITEKHRFIITFYKNNNKILTTTALPRLSTEITTQLLV